MRCKAIVTGVTNGAFVQIKHLQDRIGLYPLKLTVNPFVRDFRCPIVKTLYNTNLHRVRMSVCDPSILI